MVLFSSFKSFYLPVCVCVCFTTTHDLELPIAARNNEKTLTTFCSCLNVWFSQSNIYLKYKTTYTSHLSSSLLQNVYSAEIRAGLIHSSNRTVRAHKTPIVHDDSCIDRSPANTVNNKVLALQHVKIQLHNIRPTLLCTKHASHAQWTVL